MDKIVVKHTRIEINNYDIGDCPKLEYLFSVWDPVRHVSIPKGIEYIEEQKKLILPRGIDVPYIEDLFGCNAVVDKYNDPFVDMEPVKIKYLAKDERQLEILKFILGKDKYYYTTSKSQLSCNSTTGSGKTFVTVASICYSGARTMIITNSIDWLNQWKDRILEYTTLKESDIYMISGASSIYKLYGRNNPLDYKIFLISHSTIKSYGDKNGWDSVGELFKFLQCRMKVYDEAHLFFDNMCRIDFHTNTKKTLYLTATPSRSNQEEDTIYQLYFKNIPSISLFDENTDPHVNYFAVHFNSHPRPTDIMNCKNAYGFNRINYTNYVVSRPNFIKLCNILLDMVWNIPGKVLIYIGTNETIMSVYEHLISQFPFLEKCMGIYTSVIKEDKESNLYKKIILSTTKSTGAASDIPELSVVINLAEPFKSHVLAQQTLGRCRANNTLYIDVVDEGFYYTKRYYQHKKPIFSQYAKSCKDIYLSDEELDIRNEKILDKYNNTNMMIVPVFKEL